MCQQRGGREYYCPGRGAVKCIAKEAGDGEEDTLPGPDNERMDIVEKTSTHGPFEGKDNEVRRGIKAGTLITRSADPY